MAASTKMSAAHGSHRDESKPGGNLDGFIRLVAPDLPKLAQLVERAGVEEPRSGLKPDPRKLESELGSSRCSPGSSSAHLPQSVLQIVATSLRADAVVVAVLNPAKSNRVLQYAVDSIIATPIGFLPEVVGVSPQLIARFDGTAVSTSGLDLPPEFTDCLGTRPAVIQGAHLQLEDFEGIIFALWSHAHSVLCTAPVVMANAACSLPLLLASRLSARRSERLGRQFDAILKRMPQAVVFVDNELAQVVVNPAAADLLDLCYGEVDPVKVAGSMRQLAERRGSRSDLPRWFAMVAGTANSIIEEEWTLSDPHTVLRVQSYPSPHGRLWVFEDLTAQRAAREAITAANLAKSQFLAMMSHELRTPMTGVLGMLDLLHLTSMEKDQVGLLRVMHTSAQGLMRVINNILDYCKIEAGKVQLEAIDFCPHAMLEEIEAEFRAVVAEKNLTLTILPPGERGVVVGDPVRVKQAIHILLTNAVKFSSPSGRISVSWQQSNRPDEKEEGGGVGISRTVSAPPGPWGGEAKDDPQSPTPRTLPPSVPEEEEAEGGHSQGTAQNPIRRTSTLPAHCVLPPVACVEDSRGEEGEGGTRGEGKGEEASWYRICVADSGPGMTPEQAMMVFKDSQAGTGPRDQGGTGLGLAICKGLLLLMGGTVSVDAELGIGSKFTLDLPLRAGRHPIAPSPQGPPPNATLVDASVEGDGEREGDGEVEVPPDLRLRVLVAEDNRVNQMLIRRLLKNEGHAVEVVGNGRLALDGVQAGEFDLVLMDIQMPVMDGLAATRAIRQLHLPCAKLPIYALTADVLAQEIEDAGMDGYLSKPIVWEKMGGVVHKVLVLKAKKLAME